jgi:hypothetical protein
LTLVRDFKQIALDILGTKQVSAVSA